MKFIKKMMRKRLTNRKNPKQGFHFVLRTSYLLLAIIGLSSHDLYIKMETYFLQPNQENTFNLYNGTFEKSENIITRDRIIDASVVARGKRNVIDKMQWKDQDSTITKATFKTGEAGTYIVGVSTRARNIELTAEKFNDYLKHDGVLDMLEQRTKEGLLDQDAVESYQKSVKAIYQVGDVKTTDWSTKLGYPIEFVPLSNPYEKYSGEKLAVKLLRNGMPLVNHLLYADYIKSFQGHSHSQEHSHGEQTHSHDSPEDGGHTHTSGQQLRTDEDGKVFVNLPEDGIYYLRTIYMKEVTDDDELTHQSNWATLTFEVSHKHGEDTHMHNDDAHDSEEGFSPWMFMLGSVLMITLLFFFFRKKNS
ncbi:DUF4198 domain-containing protein [Spongiivirga sp. MCCC 1A20706]